MINGNTSSEKPFWSVLWTQRLVIAVTLVVGILLSVLIIRAVKQSYSATAHVLLVSDGREASSASADMPTIVASSIVLQRVEQVLHLTVPLEDFKKGVVARVAPRSALMQITYKNHDRVMAVNVVNAVADEFVRYYSSISGRRYTQVTSDLGSELEHAKNRVVALQRRLEAAASQRSFDGTDKSLDDITAQINSLQAQRGVANAMLVTDYGQLAGLHADSRDFAGADRRMLLNSDPSFRNLEADLAKNAATLAAMRAEYTNKLPGLSGLEDKVQHEQTSLSALAQSLVSAPGAYSSTALARISEMRKTAALVDGDRSRVNAIDDEIASARQALTSAAGDKSVGALRAERDAASAEFQALALRMGGARADRAEATALGGAMVVNYAVAAEPGLAGPRILSVLAAIAVMLAAFGAGYLVEMLDPRLRSREQVETLYGQPVIATLGGNRRENIA